MQVAWLDYLVIALYFAAVLGVGFYFSRDKATSENYLLGGRKMHYLAIGIAILMSLLSSISIVVVPGEIFNYGMTLFIIGSTLGAILGIPCYLLFTRFYFKLGSFTPYEYLEYRYDKAIRAVVAFSSFYARVMYLAMVLYTTAKIFEASYQWPPAASILLAGGAGVAYTLMGGIKAIIWNDVLQFCVLAGGFAVVIFVLCANIDGGALAAVAVAWADGRGLPQFSQPDFYGLSPYVRLLFWLLLINTVFECVRMAASDQIAIQHLLSTRNWKEGFKAQIVTSVLNLLSIIPLFFVGLAVYTYFKQNPDPMIGPGNGDSAFFRFVALKMPSPLPGLFMAGMLAAIMSTISAGFNSMAAVWLKEFHQKFINKNLSTEGEVRVSKRATLVIGAFAVLFALALVASGQWLEQSVAEVGTLFGILGAMVLPAFACAVISPRANSTLIWCYTFFSLGEVVAGNLWYALSRSALQAWEKDPTLAWGWAGPLEGIYALVPFAAALALTAPYLAGRRRGRWPVKLAALLGMAAFGFALGMFTWYAFSQYYIVDAPLARSFQFGLPTSTILVFVALRFFPKQPPEKWRGLTLGTVNEPILAADQGKQRTPDC